MSKDEIDDCWPLVLDRQSQVLQVVRRNQAHHKSVTRMDRAELLRLYDPSRDIRDIAQHFGVSPGSVNDALARLVRIARRLERDATIERAALGKRHVVIVPVDNKVEGEYVLSVLADHELRGIAEELDDEWLALELATKDQEERFEADDERDDG